MAKGFQSTKKEYANSFFAEHLDSFTGGQRKTKGPSAIFFGLKRSVPWIIFSLILIGIFEALRWFWLDSGFLALMLRLCTIGAALSAVANTFRQVAKLVKKPSFKTPAQALTAYFTQGVTGEDDALNGPNDLYAWNLLTPLAQRQAGGWEDFRRKNAEMNQFLVTTLGNQVSSHNDARNEFQCAIESVQSTTPKSAAVDLKLRCEKYRWETKSTTESPNHRTEQNRIYINHYDYAMRLPLVEFSGRWHLCELPPTVLDSVAGPPVVREPASGE